MDIDNRSPEPSEAQRELWWQYVIASAGVEWNGWWLGHCPLHDRDGVDDELPTAQFNFIHGAMRCLGEPSCLAPKSVMSLTNVLVLSVRGHDRAT